MNQTRTLLLLNDMVIFFVFSALSMQAYAQAVASNKGLGHWFWYQFPWFDFGTAAFVSLVGGAIRTAMTLRNDGPTERVLIEGLADAGISFLVGGVLFLFIMVWQVYRSPVDLFTVAAICLIGGLLRGWVIDFLLNRIKALMGIAADAFAGWAAAGLNGYLAKRSIDKTAAPADEPLKGE